MNNKNSITRQCKYLNEARRVKAGSVTSDEFFCRVTGDLLISGKDAGNMRLVENLVHNYFVRDDLPTIVLTSHMQLTKSIGIRDRKRQIITSRDDRNYMPFYNMDAQQIIPLVSYTVDKLGYSGMNSKVLLYCSSILNIVVTQYPLSLPAITKLLEEDDDFISGLAIHAGLSNVVADNIRANHEAGIILRRVFEYIENVFGEVYEPGRDSKYNFQSAVMGNVNGMIMFVCSSDQELMNKWLKDEIYNTIKCNIKIRVILDEVPFISQNDELIKFLLTSKKQGRIELVLVTKNVLDVVSNGSDLDFANIIMFQHSTPTAVDDISRAVFGTFQYHYPVSGIGDVPHILFSVKKSVHWDIRTEERLRVCSKDL